jgi:hypothetical protein
MSTREEIRQRRIERLLDQLEAASANWAAAEHQDGVESGRHGVASAGIRKGRDRAELKVKDLVLQLRRATKQPPSGR